MKAKFAIISIIFICCRFRKMLLVVIAEHNDFSSLCSHINVFIFTWDCLHVGWKIPLPGFYSSPEGTNCPEYELLF